MITLPSGRKIGQNSPPFIIAEVGSNFRDKADCIKSIQLAKSCAASAVKFQLYDSKALYGFDGVPVKGVLDPAWLPHMAEKAKAVGIDFLCTAFSPEGYNLVNEYVPAHKVASAESTHVRILERLRKIGKPVILSTGAHGVEDIRQALKALGPTPVILMYCVAAYPARHVEIVSMGLLKMEFKTPVGFSDHTTDVGVIPLAFVKKGACVIEKHVNFVDAKGPDAEHSLSCDEFKQMVESIRYDGLGRIGTMPSEKPMILRHNRRLIAIKDIAKLEKLVENTNFGIYRSLKDDTHAYGPFMVDEVNGKTARRAIKAGDGIGPGDI